MDDSSLFCCPDGAPRVHPATDFGFVAEIQVFSDWVRKTTVDEVIQVDARAHVPSHGFFLTGSGGRSGRHVSMLEPRFFIPAARVRGGGGSLFFQISDTMPWEALGLKMTRIKAWSCPNHDTMYRLSVFKSAPYETTTISVPSLAGLSPPSTPRADSMGELFVRTPPPETASTTPTSSHPCRTLQMLPMTPPETPQRDGERPSFGSGRRPSSRPATRPMGQVADTTTTSGSSSSRWEIERELEETERRVRNLRISLSRLDGEQQDSLGPPSSSSSLAMTPTRPPARQQPPTPTQTTLRWATSGSSVGSRQNPARSVLETMSPPRPAASLRAAVASQRVPSVLESYAQGRADEQDMQTFEYFPGTGDSSRHGGFWGAGNSNFASGRRTRR